MRYEEFDEEPYDDNPPPSGDFVCDCCGMSCRPKLVDEGIGCYEYWGFKGTDVRYEWRSSCCEASLVEGGSKLMRAVNRIAKKCYTLGCGKQILPGERYLERVFKCWRENGPSWFVTERTKYGLGSSRS